VTPHEFDDVALAVEAAIRARQGRQSGAEVLFLAPCHDDHRPSARYRPNKQTWYCDPCGTGGGLLSLAKLLDLELDRWRPAKVAKPANPRRAGTIVRPAKVATPATDVRSLVARMWRSTRPAAGSLVECYLRSRGLTLRIPPTLRYAPVIPHRPSGRELPAMVAPVTIWPNRMPTAVHRTYLAPSGDGKADVEPQRMALGPVRGGAIRLAPAGRVLVLAEGIETALSVQQATNLPAWAAMSASNLPSVFLPELPLAAEVVIAADPDPAGLRAAHLAADRWTAEGRRVRIAAPPPGGDFNDLLQRVM
jgi:putative DNA primase/helicase